jgi:hypothetical protein
MKIVGLIIGIGLTILSFIVFVICLMLPSMTNNRINRGESMVGIVPSIIFLFIGLIIAIISAVLMMKSKKTNS